MSGPLKVGDRLYAVYGDLGSPVIQIALVVAIGAKTVKLSDPSSRVVRTGLAFGCRSQFRLDQIECFSRTEQEAWAKYVLDLQRQIAQAEKDLASLRKQLNKAQKRLT